MHIKDGQVIVMPTDTVYGLACKAFDEVAVEKMYKLKRRNTEKPFVFLISDKKDLKLFGVDYDKELEKYWPGPTSVILKCDNELDYLHRGKGTIAVRLPDKDEVIDFIKENGPLATTSANIEGMDPAQNINEAKGYFGDGVDLYIDGGELPIKSSRIISLSGDVLRS